MRSAALRRTTYLRPRSAKTARLYRKARIPLVARILAERPYCEVVWDAGCTGQAVMVHEPLTRARGGSITDDANTLTCCAHCHAQVHAHPARSHELGFLRHTWEAP